MKPLRLRAIRKRRMHGNESAGNNTAGIVRADAIVARRVWVKVDNVITPHNQGRDPKHRQQQDGTKSPYQGNNARRRQEQYLHQYQAKKALSQ
jgi:hypothetical protein